MATSKRKDFTQTALDVVRKATDDVAAPAPGKKPESGRKKLAATPKAPVGKPPRT